MTRTQPTASSKGDILQLTCHCHAQTPMGLICVSPNVRHSVLRRALCTALILMQMWDAAMICQENTTFHPTMVHNVSLCIMPGFKLSKLSMQKIRRCRASSSGKLRQKTILAQADQYSHMSKRLIRSLQSTTGTPIAHLNT